MSGVFHHIPRVKPLGAKRGATVAVLDLGTNKVCCLIGRLKPLATEGHSSLRSHAIEVMGVGYQRSNGVKAGIVVDMVEAEQTIRLAVDQAERMAGVTISGVIVNVTGGRLASELFSASVAMGGHAVEDSDLNRVLDAGAAGPAGQGRVVLHSLPISYALDHERHIRDPRGMVGDRLSVDLNVVSADPAPLKNLLLCVERAHLSIEGLVSTPYASGLSVLVDDEADLGTAVIDMGGGTTTVAVFTHGRFVYADAIGVGGNHVTMDIARGLSTRQFEAERIKTLFGCVFAGASDEREMISVPPLSEEDRDVPNHVPKAMLTRIIRPRVEETLELVRDRLQQNGFAKAAARHVVLTGGASQLTGMAELARRTLGGNVRLGRPLGLQGLPESVSGPSFAAAAGLLIYPQMAHLEHFEGRRTLFAATGTHGYFSRMGQWLRESF